ncbi:UPF0161 protein At3g09310 [Punica granatum]|uniref:Uncharacterized protein n=2 Tax=Punica granatum TaxID=22663 RepID=A0A2I0IHH7_PUNGR|nr:UPF0161 protein At3g09310 [Punica granatum]PKI43467.1 hypothetical protein CRG98_036224 [Punica granatum]
MAVVLRLDPLRPFSANCVASRRQNPRFCPLNFQQHQNRSSIIGTSFNLRRGRGSVASQLDSGSDPNSPQDEKEDSAGVKVALSMLRFYKREISPLLPNSCRYIPTCSEYSMEAYKKYGVAKGTVLTAWRLCRCNPLGGSGFDPPRWFNEERPSPEE